MSKMLDFYREGNKPGVVAKLKDKAKDVVRSVKNKGVHGPEHPVRTHLKAMVSGKGGSKNLSDTAERIIHKSAPGIFPKVGRMGKTEHVGRLKKFLSWSKASAAPARQAVLDKLMEKYAGTVLEEESAKGAYASTPEGKCAYMRRQGASKDAIKYYCQDKDEKEAKEEKTGKKAKGRKDVRDVVKKAILEKEATPAPPPSAPGATPAPPPSAPGAMTGRGRLWDTFLGGQIGGRVAAGMGGIAADDDDNHRGRTVAHKGVIPVTVGTGIGNLIEHSAPDKYKKLGTLSKGLGYGAAMYRGFSEQKKLNKEDRVKAILEKKNRKNKKKKS